MIASLLSVVFIASSSPAPLKLEHTLKAGDKTVYAIHLTAEMEAGQADISEVSQQTVKSVDLEGNADVELVSSDYSVAIGGMQPPASEPGTFTLQVDKKGIPLGRKGDAVGLCNKLQFLHYVMVAYGATLDSEKTTDIGWVSPTDPQSRIEGAVKLLSSEGKEAKVKETLKVYFPGSEKPMRMNATAVFRLSDGVLTSVDGNVTDIPSSASRYSIPAATFQIALK